MTLGNIIFGVWLVLCWFLGGAFATRAADAYRTGRRSGPFVLLAVVAFMLCIPPLGMLVHAMTKGIR